MTYLRFQILLQRNVIAAQDRDTPADNYGQDQATGSSHKLIHIPAPHDGPVVVMIDIEVDRTLGRDMLDILREVRLIRLRNGAFNWRLHEDLGRPNTYRVEMMYRVESAIDSRDCQNDHDGGHWDTKATL